MVSAFLSPPYLPCASAMRSVPCLSRKNAESSQHTLPSAKLDMHFSVQVVAARVDLCRDILLVEDKGVQARMRPDV